MSAGAVPSLESPEAMPRGVAAHSVRDNLERDYNIAYSRRRFLKAMVPAAELREMAELERLCFPPCENYDLRTLRMFVSKNGAGLIRLRDPGPEGRPLLTAFHLFDCLAAELITLDVHPLRRRQGIGQLLVSESMSKLREFGHDRVTCEIGITNEASLELHQRLGFQTKRLLKNYYGHGRHAYLLAARL